MGPFTYATQCKLIDRRQDRSLAQTLVQRIFVLYLGIALILTLLQIYIEYNNTYTTVLSEVDATAKAFEPGISDAIWNFQQPLLDSIAQGMVSGGAITKVEIDDVYQHLKVKLTRNDSRFDVLNISKKIPLFRTYSDGNRVSIGLMTVYSTHEIVIERVKIGILLILIASIIKTIGLWFIIMFCANRLLAKPLGRFTEQIKTFNLTQATPIPPIDLGPNLSAELIYLQETFNELAKRVVASKQLVVQKEAAEAASLAKSSFLAAASHDLRQPMHALNLYLAMFENLDLSKSTRTCIDNMSKCAKAMSDMLDALLDISSIDAGAIQLNFGVFNIDSILNRMRIEFEPLAHTKGLFLRIVPCSVWLYSDEKIVERILRNLLANAVRYTDRGKILVGCRRQGAQLNVGVYDTGSGIALDKQCAIFEEFYQVNNKERNRAHGLGLGLAIVQRLVKLIGSHIILTSKLNLGSIFSFNLPRFKTSAIQAIDVAATTDSQSLEHALIAVIDDEPLVLDAMRFLLESWGCTVITATNRQEAIAQLKLMRLPDVILCDYLLAEKDTGVSVIAALRTAFGKEIPAILITGDTLPADMKAIRMSNLPVMYKPIDHSKLKLALLQLIVLPQSLVE